MGAGLHDAGFELADLDRILLTHYDVDHVGGLTAFDSLDLTIYVGTTDAPFVTGERNAPLSNHKGVIQRLGRLLVSVPDNPVKPLEDGDTSGRFTELAARALDSRSPQWGTASHSRLATASETA